MGTTQNASSYQNVFSRSRTEPIPMIACVCPHCGESFLHRQAIISPFTVSCPHCHENLWEEDFDMVAAELLDYKSRLCQELDRLKSKLTQSSFEQNIPSRKSGINNFIHHVCQPYLLQQKASYEDRIASIEQELHDLRYNLDQLAAMRYYLSFWYAKTKLPLSREFDTSYELAPYYASDGSWVLPANDEITRYLVACYEVFSRLMTCALDQESNLFGAQIVPLLYLSSLNGESENAKYRSQVVDCLVLCREGAFVLKTAYSNKHIYVDACFEELLSTPSATVFNDFIECKESLEQLLISELDVAETVSELEPEQTLLECLWDNSDAAALCSTLLEEYEYDQIYEQLVVVNPVEFYGESQNFFENINVNCCFHGVPYFIQSIEQVCAHSDAVVSQDVIESLAHKLLVGDFHGFTPYQPDGEAAATYLIA